MLDEQEATERYQPRTPEEIAALCESLDCDLVVADSRTLLLDLDTPAAVEQFNRNRGMADSLWKFAKIEQWTSNHGNTHIVVTLVEPIGDWTTRLMLQAALGSDGKREMLSWNEYRDGHATPSVLFKPRKPTVPIGVNDPFDDLF